MKSRPNDSMVVVVSYEDNGIIQAAKQSQRKDEPFRLFKEDCFKDVFDGPNPLSRITFMGHAHKNTFDAKYSPETFIDKLIELKFDFDRVEEMNLIGCEIGLNKNNFARRVTEILIEKGYSHINVRAYTNSDSSLNNMIGMIVSFSQNNPYARILGITDKQTEDAIKEFKHWETKDPRRANMTRAEINSIYLYYQQKHTVALSEYFHAREGLYANPNFLFNEDELNMEAKLPPDHFALRVEANNLIGRLNMEKTPQYDKQDLIRGIERIRSKIEDPKSDIGPLKKELNDKYQFIKRRVIESDEKRKWTFLIYAIELGIAHEVIAFIKMGVDPFKQQYGRLPIQVAKTHNYSVYREIMYHYGSSPNPSERARIYQFDIGDNELIKKLALNAAEKGYVDVINHLAKLHGGAAILNDCKNAEGQTLLHIAAEKGQVNIIRACNDLKFDFNVRDQLNRTPMHIAAEHNQPDAIETLYEYKSRLDLKDSNNNTPKDIATAKKFDNVMHVLEKINTQELKHLTDKLISSIHRGDMPEAYSLIRQGADPHSIDSRTKYSFLSLSLSTEQLEMAVHMLVSTPSMELKNLDENKLQKINDKLTDQFIRIVAEMKQPEQKKKYLDDVLTGRSALGAMLSKHRGPSFLYNRFFSKQYVVEDKEMKLKLAVTPNLYKITERFEDELKQFREEAAKKSTPRIK